MNDQKSPKGWTQKRIRELAAHHDQQPEQEQVKEIEAALSAKGETVMLVPTKLVPEIQALIARKGGA